MLCQFLIYISFVVFSCISLILSTSHNCNITSSNSYVIVEECLFLIKCEALWSNVMIRYCAIYELTFLKIYLNDKSWFYI